MLKISLEIFFWIEWGVILFHDLSIYIRKGKEQNTNIIYTQHENI